jgi:hypothetical protein
MPPRHVLSHLAGEAFPDVETVAVGEASFKDAVRLGTPEVHATNSFTAFETGKNVIGKVGPGFF